MLISEVEILAKGLMNGHGLSHWRLEFDRCVKRFGCCKHGSRVISLSIPLCSINDFASVEDTILHEIAHALVGAGHGHDWVWKNKCIEIGCKPIRCYGGDGDDTRVVPLRYKAECGGCGVIHYKTRYKEMIGRKRSCRCQSHISWDKRILLEYIDTKQY